jgi:hypothetical protein
MQTWRQASRPFMQAGAKFWVAHGYLTRHASMHGPFWVGSSKSIANVLGTTDSMKAAIATKKTNNCVYFDWIMIEPPFDPKCCSLSAADSIKLIEDRATSQDRHIAAPQSRFQQYQDQALESLRIPAGRQQ